MSEVELTEKLLAQAGGWQAMKEARALLAEGRVISANWNPPNLSGEVRGPAGSMNTGLIIEDHINVENLCRCREARQWGKICGHALAIGLKVLQPPETEKPLPEKPARKPSSESVRPPKPFPLRFAESPADAADHARLHLVFPPNLDAALARGSATIACEFSVDDNRRPLNLVPCDEPLYWSEQDRVILGALLARCDNEPPAVVSLAAPDFAELLTELAGFERATFGRRDPAVIRGDSVTPPVSAELKPDGSIDLAAKWPMPMPTVLPGRVFWLLDGREFRPLQLPPGGAALLQSSLTLKRAQVPAFLQNDFPVLSADPRWSANFSLSDFDVNVGPPDLAVQLEGGLARLRARVVANYGKQAFELGDKSAPASSPWIIDPAGPTSYRLRDLAAEQDCLARLVRAGFEGPDREGSWRLTGQDDVLRFFARDFPDWQRRYRVTLEERLDRSLEKNVERVEARCEVRSSGEQWFDFGVRYQTTGGEVFSPADIQRLVLGGQSHTKTRGGKFALIDTGAVEELQEVLVDAAPRQEGGGYRFRNEQAAYLNATIERQADWKLEAPTAWCERADLASSAREVDLGPFNEVLRPYQREGVQWLHKLRAGGFGGVLADEMGLGKTLQAIACIATRGQGASKPAGPCLVVCPTSLIFNWRAELEKFAPGLKTLVLHGPGRHPLFATVPEHDVVITSYALVRRDAEQHRENVYDTVILDEAQHIKNRRSQNAQAVKSVRCAHRLVLTGTPMENSVLDLWSIFDFLMPGYLGNEKDFKERYELPLTRAKDASVQARLTRRVRPFILRRMKRDVAADLPDKIEQVAYCELNEEQRGAYEQVLEAGRREVLDAVGKQGFGKSKMVIFNALLRLRQIACDLRLLPDQRDEKFAVSGKLELFDELLEEITDGGHRVLVFSQFTKMLGLVRERLEAESIDYCYLDGSTRDRGEVVARFQGSTVPVFLISLKAGGVGLNLTGADTVVHFDPWWNPAVEDQATDRAHRIGQQRVVTSYKLIARDTVEEKILKLQQRKREAVRAVFGGEEQLTDALDWEEVQELFA